MLNQLWFDNAERVGTSRQKAAILPRAYTHASSVDLEKVYENKSHAVLILDTPAIRSCPLRGESVAR